MATADPQPTPQGISTADGQQDQLMGWPQDGTGTGGKDQRQNVGSGNGD